jgi:hypothetical protein
LAVIRKLALNALMQEKSLKGGVATKQCAAACNPQYRDKLVGLFFSLLEKDFFTPTAQA